MSFRSAIVVLSALVALGAEPATAAVGAVPLAGGHRGGVSADLSGRLVVRQDRVLAPAADLAAILTAAFHYEADTGLLTLARGDTEIALAVGSRLAHRNGWPAWLDTPPLWHGGEVYVPVRWVAEAFGFEVTWDGQAGALQLRVPETGAPLRLVVNRSVPAPRPQATWADLLALVPVGYGLDPATGGFTDGTGQVLSPAESDQIWSQLLHSTAGRALLLTAAILAPATGLNPLTRITPEPGRTSHLISERPGLAADIYLPGGPEPGPYPAVLLHSPLAGAGRADLQLVKLATALARLGYAVIVPMREPPPPIGPGDVADVGAALRLLVGRPEVAAAPIRFVCVSYGAGPCAATAAKPEWRQRVPVIVTMGGYASLPNLAVLALSGVHPDRPEADFVPDPYVTALIQEGLALWALSDPAVMSLAGESDPERLSARIGAMKGPARRWLDDLSPAGSLQTWPGVLYAVHSTSDPYIPHHESELLASALGSRGQLALVRVFNHARLTESVPWPILLARYGGDLLRLYEVAQGLLDPTSHRAAD